MAAIPTARNEIDQKLHKIILESNPEKFSNMMALARSLEAKKRVEFSYTRGEDTQYSTASTIHSYVSYAKEISLLDGDLASTRRKSDIEDLENFQQWLSDTVVTYLDENNSSINEIKTAVRGALQATPHELPTQRKVHSRLNNPPQFQVFRLSIKIVSILRPQALIVRSRRVVLIPGLLVG